MPSAVIGALRVDLDLGTAGWNTGLSKAGKDAEAAKAKFQKIGGGIATAGAALTVGVTAPFTALLSKAIPAATESAQAMGQVEAALKSMGPAAGRTKEQLAEAATELMHLSTFDDDEILRKVTANLLTFGTVAGEQFDRAQKAAVDLSTRMGGDLQSATLLVGKALNDPIKGMGALRKVGIQLTDQQKEQVKAFVAAGNAAGAQGVILTELERQFGGSAKAMRDATPGIDSKNEWDDFTETVGGLALKVLPSLTAVLATVLGLFNQLDPTTQAVAVGAVAILAALGPISGAIGLLVSGFGALIPIFTATAVAEGAAATASVGLWAALAPALPIIAAIAGAVALAYAAWQHWDEIAPILSGLWATLSETFGPPLIALFDTVKGVLVDLWNGPFGELLRQVAANAAQAFGDLMARFGELGALFGTVGGAIGNVLGPVLKAVFAGFVTYVGETFKVVGGLLNTLAALVQGDFSGAWTYLKKTIVDAVGGVGRIIEAMVPGALAAMQRLVEGVRDWMIGKLGAIWDTVKGGIDKVKGFFYGLYDAVVGHSYVPDMVDGIQDQMARLDAVMVAPAKGATSKVAASFKALAGELRPLLDELFPDEAAALKLERSLAVIERARKAGPAKGGLTDDQAAEARRRLYTGERAPFDPFKDAPTELVPTGDFKIGMEELLKGLRVLENKTRETTAKMVESFAGMARDVLGSLRGMVSAFKGGDILGGLTGLLDIVVQVAGLFGKGGAFAPRVAAAPAPIPYGGGRALGGPVVPGKRYRVGETGKPEWFEPGMAGRIVPGSSGGGGNTYHFQGNMMTPEFWAQIQAGDDGAAVRGATGGAAMAQQQSAYARGRYLG